MKEKLLCGIDLGGTKLSAAVFTRKGELITEVKTHDHVGRSNDETVRIMAGLVNELAAESGISIHDLEGIGIGAAIFVLYEKGVIIFTSNFKIPFINYPMVEKLQHYFPGMRILLDNDANAQALGEAKFGAGRPYHNLVFITASTGVGAGIIINDKVYRGKSGTAGEVGHSIIEQNSDKLCTCGNCGCGMRLSSGLFFTENYRSKLEEGKTSILGITAETLSHFSGHDLEEGLKRGDPISVELWDDSIKALGTTVFNTHQFLDPEAIVIGGGMMHISDDFLPRIRERFLSLAGDMVFIPTEILLSTAGNNAGLLGAAALLLE